MRALILLVSLSLLGWGCGSSGDGPAADQGPLADQGPSDNGTIDDAATDQGPVVMPLCGNGVVDSGEACDDGNGILADACPDGPTGTCQAASCNDGFMYIAAYGGTETCDDGGNAPGDGCSATCSVESTTCGNGTTETGESCDLGANNSNTASGACPNVCRATCRCPACGDGVVDYARGEECDDWNPNSGDGCSAACVLEVGSACGNGMLEAAQGEACDDGGNAPNDGCSATCQLEPVGAMCGDGNMDTGEVCDDGDLMNGDGCNPTCNLLGNISPFLSVAGVTTMYADNTYLWMAVEGSGAITRVDIAACITALASAGSCTVQTVISGLTGAATTPVSDGTTLWYAHGSANNFGPYIMSLDIAACESAGLPCNALPQIEAGTAAWGGHSDGLGTAAGIGELRGLTYYNGKVYFLDGNCGTLRSFDPATTAVRTLVGPSSPTCPSTAAQTGYGSAARLGSPRYMTSDGSGNLFLTDNGDHRIYRYNVATGYLDVFLGSGTAGYQDSPNPALAQLSRPRDITSDGTSVYWAEYNGFTLRQADLLTAGSSTLVGAPNTCGDVAGAGTNARMGKPFTTAFHFPTRSIFVMSSQANGDAAGTGECVGMTIPTRIWRVR
ncbi:MAG: hypothetical protein IPH72_22130 [Sandaracinaceae bacterium]|nr:hypothetical protein [Sandaracinaceae bacterium]